MFLGFLAGLSAQEPKDETLPAERIIYIPYQQLEKLIQKADTGIYLPYKDYQKLLDEVDKSRQRPPELPALVLISSANYKGRVVGDFLEITATYNLNILQKGWHGVTLGFKNVAIKEASLDGKPALLRWQADNYELIFESETAGQKQLEVVFVCTLVKSLGFRLTADFFVPRSPIARLSLEIPTPKEEEGQGPKLKIDVYPSLQTKQTFAPGVTQVEALLGNTDEIKIQWESQAERKVEIKQILHAENLSRLEIGENFLQLQAKIAYDLIQGDTQKLMLKIPKGFRVLSVSSVQGSGVRDWSVNESESSLLVNLIEKLSDHGENKSDMELAIKLEKMFSDMEKKFAIPSLEVLGVEREKGFYTIAVNDLHTIKIIQRKDITQIDIADLPERDRDGVQFAFKYLKRPFSLEVELEKIEPEYELFTNVYAYLDETIYKLYGYFQYQVKKSRIFGTKIEMPQGFLLFDVKAYNLAEPGALNVDQIKEYREVDEEVNKEKKHFLAITFKKGIRSDKLVVRVHLQRKLDAQEKTREIPLPVFRVEGAAREMGNIGLGVHSSYNITTVEKSQKNISPLDIGELFQQGERPPQTVIKNINIGIRYFDHPIAATFKIEKRDPLVTAEIYTYVSVEESVLKYRIRLLYTVKYTGVKEFAFTLPEEIAKDVPKSHISDKQRWIKEIRREEQKEAKTVLYTILTQRDVLRQEDKDEPYEIQVVYEKKIPQVEISKQIPIFELITQNTKQEHGFIVFKKNNNFSMEFSSEAKGVERADVQDPNYRGEKDGVLAIYKYTVHPFQLVMDLQRLEFEPVLNTVINRLHLSTTVNKDHTTRSEAVALLINNSKQMLDFEVPEGSKVTSVSRLKVFPAQIGTYPQRYEIDRHLESLTWSKSDGPNKFRVNIAANIQKNTSFVVVIKYEGKLQDGEMQYRGKFALTPLTFPTDVPVSYFRWDLGLPHEYQYVWFASNMVSRRFYNSDQYGIWNSLYPLFHSGQVDNSEIKQDAETGVIPLYDIQGKLFSFTRLNGGGYVKTCYVYNNWLYVLELFFFVVVCSLIFWVPKIYKVSRLTVFMTITIVCLFLSSFNWQGYQQIYETMLSAALLSGGVAIVVHWGKLLGNRMLTWPVRKPNNLVRDAQPAGTTGTEAKPKSDEQDNKGNGGNQNNSQPEKK